MKKQDMSVMFFCPECDELCVEGINILKYDKRKNSLFFKDRLCLICGLKFSPVIYLDELEVCEK